MDIAITFSFTKIITMNLGRNLSTKQFSMACVAFIALEMCLFLFIDRPLAAYFSLPEIDEVPIIRFFFVITDFGKAEWYLWPTGILSIVCFFLVRGKDVTVPFRHLFGYMGTRVFFLFSGVALSGIVTDIIKPVLGRARPTLWLHKAIYGFSPFTFDAKWNGMPSGHTTTIVAVACCLNIFYPKLRIVWMLCATLIALSRIVVGAHFASDVIAGALIGWLSVIVCLHYGKALSETLFMSQSLPPRRDENT